MRLIGVEILTVELPLATPFRTSRGTEHVRRAVLVRAVSPEIDGWGECGAAAGPYYSPEYADQAVHVLQHFLVPALGALETVSAHQVAPALANLKGHRTAKAALETAVLDAELRTRGESLADALGAVRTTVACGVSVGIPNSIPELIDIVGGYLADGYLRIKLKIEPGWDIEPVRAVREEYGDVPLQVDANTAYQRSDARHLSRLDAFDLLLLEQPLAEDDLLGHAELSRSLSTPICLDESIVSARSAADAIALGACRIINIKPGRVGGYLEARRVHDVCVAHGVPVWCGGMLETGLGRAANLALAALPGFSLPGDTSASERYFHTDLTEPFVLDGGHLAVPTGPGIGVALLPEVLEDVVVERVWLPLT
ncbi:o-succinylbenzoate synthase [Intrasporangium mesophilum]